MEPRRSAVSANWGKREGGSGKRGDGVSGKGDRRNHGPRRARETFAARATRTARFPRPAFLFPLILLAGCSWFTDFKQQPKIDPWETTSDTIAFRGNPQNSVSIYGSSAPGFIYYRAPSPQAVAAMAGIPNPIPADSASVNRGRIQYQINCAVGHGSRGAGDGVVLKYGMFPPAIGGAANPSAGYTDGYIFGIIRNGRGLM